MGCCSVKKLGILTESIEEEFEIHWGIIETISWSNDESSGNGGLHIEGIGEIGTDSTEFETKFLADFVGGCVDEEMIGFNHDNTVDEHFYIVNLVGADDDGTLVGHLGSDNLTELGF